MESIPFNQQIDLKESRYLVEEVLQSGHTGGDGPFGKKCEQLLEAELDLRRVLMTTSCTHALEMAALLYDIGEGDEVIMPSFTFVSTANAFALRGAKIRFCDIRPDTLNLDAEKLRDLVTGQTKAVVVVHYGGIACDLDEILEIIEPRGIKLVEDNAHGLFGKYKGKWLGSFGGVAAQSFHETKNFSSGEGGALVINDPDLIERAEIIREKGTDRTKFFRGEVDKYSWVELGSSYVMSDLLAAFLLGQLRQWPKVQQKRQETWLQYAESFRDWASRHGVELPHVPVYCDQAFHLFYLLLPSLEMRDALIRHLKAKRITAVFHYLPLHRSPYMHQQRGESEACPVSEDISKRLVRLPMFYNLQKNQAEVIIDAVCGFQP